MGTSQIHDHLRSYREHQAYELMIQHMEQSIDDCKRATADLKASQHMSTAALAADDDGDDGAMAMTAAGAPADHAAMET